MGSWGAIPHPAAILSKPETHHEQLRPTTALNPPSRETDCNRRRLQAMRRSTGNNPSRIDYLAQYRNSRGRCRTMVTDQARVIQSTGEKLMDPRISITSNNHGKHFALGKHFDSHDEAYQYAEQTIARREAIAGRPLTRQELAWGIDKQTKLSVREKMDAEQWQPVMPPEPPRDDNPYRPEKKEPTTRKELMKQKEREWDERKKREAQEAAPPDPRRAQAIAWAEVNLERMQFSDVPESQVVLAEQLLRQAKQGTLDHFAVMSHQAIDVQKQLFTDRAAAIKQAAAAAELELAKVPRPVSPFSIDPRRQTRVTKFLDGSVDVVDTQTKQVLARYKPGDELPQDVAESLPTKEVSA